MYRALRVVGRQACALGGDGGKRGAVVLQYHGCVNSRGVGGVALAQKLIGAAQVDAVAVGGLHAQVSKVNDVLRLPVDVGGETIPRAHAGQRACLRVAPDKHFRALPQHAARGKIRRLAPKRQRQPALLHGIIAQQSAQIGIIGG